MSGNNILVDTNILINILNGETKNISILATNDVHISFITKIELFSKPNLNDLEVESINQILNQCKLEYIDDEIIKQTADVRRKYKLKTPDAIIVSTAKCKGYSVLTDDTEIKNKLNDNLLFV